MSWWEDLVGKLPAKTSTTSITTDPWTPESSTVPINYPSQYQMQNSQSGGGGGRMSISSAGNVGIYAPISGSPVQLTRITSAVGMARLDQEIKAVYWQWGSYAVDSMLEELRVAHGNS